ncbi:MAG TPA: LLM class flavin-dependent oxidoreductase [Microbacteriaceae bacterium]|nr:LLM class flavin-dependent oxidoreductase [Microbacteriaceae bacterium]
MKHGINIPPFTDASTVVKWTREAEEAGWDGVFLWDHMQWRPGVAPLDPWVLLGAMAQVTERVLLGPLVTPLSRRRPQVVAKHIATLDHLSGGRAVLGVGLGEPVDRDFADLGEETDARVRAAMLDEALTVIDSLLTGPTDFQGEHYQIRADFHPRPLQRPRPPIWVAGLTPNRLPLVRSRRWEGTVPISPEGPLTPEQLAEHLLRDGAARPADWDVVITPERGIPVKEYADAGATWLVHSAWPTESGWESEISAIVDRGPDRT